MERTPSHKGIRTVFKKAGPEDSPELSQHLEKQDLGNGASIELFLGSFCTITGDRLGESTSLPEIEPSQAWRFCMSLNRSNGIAASGGRNNTLAQYAGRLVNKRLAVDEIKVLVRSKNATFAEPLQESELKATVEKSIEKWVGKNGDADPDSWRESCKSFSQLSAELPKFLIDGLYPKGCLTAISAHSFNCKSWFAMQSAWALSQGEPLWCFAVSEPVPIFYHVPEMHEAQVRHYADIIGVRNTDNFLVRPMEQGAWPLDDPRMLKSSEGRAVFLDTQGFFNPGDDGNDYQQALKFGRLVFNLLNAGCLGVVALFHLAKNNAKEAEWTLQNSIIGSTGYGAMMRSCLRITNLNPDLNDHNVKLYVQGMKNPGLKPFQLEGPMPLKLKVPPGDSPYLKSLLSGNSAYEDARALFAQKLPQRKIAAQLGLSLGTVNKLARKWKEEKEPESPGY